MLSVAILCVLFVFTHGTRMGGAASSEAAQHIDVTLAGRRCPQGCPRWPHLPHRHGAHGTSGATADGKPFSRRLPWRPGSAACRRRTCQRRRGGSGSRPSRQGQEGARRGILWCSLRRLVPSAPARAGYSVAGGGVRPRRHDGQRDAGGGQDRKRVVLRRPAGTVISLRLRPRARLLVRLGKHAQGRAE